MAIPNIFSQSIPTAGRSRKQWVAILAISISLGTLLFFYREPILDFASKAWTWLSTSLSGLTANTFFSGIWKWMEVNPGQTIGVGISVGTSLFALAKYYGEAKAKTAALQAQLQSQTSLQNYQNQYSDVIAQKEAQIRQLQSQTSTKGLESLQSSLGESQGLVTRQAEQIKSLNSQIEALNNVLWLKENRVVEKPVVT